MFFSSLHSPSLIEPESHILCPGLAWPLFLVLQLTYRLLPGPTLPACDPQTFLTPHSKLSIQSDFAHPSPESCHVNLMIFPSTHPSQLPDLSLKSRLVPGYTYYIPTQFPVSTGLHSTKVCVSFRFNLTCTSSVLSQFAFFIGQRTSKRNSHAQISSQKYKLYERWRHYSCPPSPPKPHHSCRKPCQWKLTRWALWHRFWKNNFKHIK